MLLTGFLHSGKLAVVKFVLIDVSPIVGRCVHWETASDGPVSSNDDIVLTSPTVPLREAQLTVWILNDSLGGAALARRGSQEFLAVDGDLPSS
jgi:hypothetical protein